MASMNRGLNLPAIQRIMNEFEKESATMDMKEEMMSDAVDDVMQDEAEDEEEEGDKILQQVLDEIGVNLQHQVKTPTCFFYFASLLKRKLYWQLNETPTGIVSAAPLANKKQAIAIGEDSGGSVGPPKPSGGSSGGGLSEEDELQARLDNLRKL
jgi:charged multivesicular body protein 2A